MTRTILLAEDSRTEALVIRALLEREGYVVETVSNGREGLKQVARVQPDLVISDVAMPLMDGYAFCEAMKADEATRAVPFILLTGRSEPADILDGLLRGADNFISKPFEPANLLERVRRILELADVRARSGDGSGVALAWNGRQVAISADQRQIVELLFTKAEEVATANRELEISRAALQRHAESLEEMVRERTRLLQHTLEGYKELVDSVDELIFACDARGAITSVNAAAEGLLGRAEETLVGAGLETIVAQASWPALQRAIHEAGGGGRPRERIELVDAASAPVPVELRLLALRDDGRPVGWQGIARRVLVAGGPLVAPAAEEPSAAVRT